MSKSLKSLCSLLEYSQINLLDKLINAKNDNGDTPLHETCRNKHTDVVTTLINASADLNVKNNNSDTPLNIALKYDMTSVAKILREAGAVS